MSSSPIHVHVQDNTPLHVHVKKPKKSNLSKNPTEALGRSGNARHSARPTPRGKSQKIQDPWIPAPGKTSIRDKADPQFKWDSGRAQLEIRQPSNEINIYPTSGDTLKTSDLSTEEDNKLRSHINEYERKIESLMAEVGTLKNEASELSDYILSRRCDMCDSAKSKTAKHRFDETTSPSKDEKKDGFKKRINYHERCFTEPVEYNPTDRRALETLSKLVKSAKKTKSRLNRQKNLCSQKDFCLKAVADANSASPTVYADSSYRTDFEAANAEKAKKQSYHSPKCTVGFAEPLVEKQKNRITQVQPALFQPDAPGPPAPERDSMSHSEWRCSYDVEPDTDLNLKKTEEELGDKEEQLELSRVMLEDKQKELHYIAKEYEETEKENSRLRRSMERYRDDMATSLKEMENLTTEDDALLRQLVEVEVCGTEAGKQVAALRDVVKRLKYERRLSHADVNALNDQRDLLLRKLEDFETVNRTVRRLLQAEHKSKVDVKRLEDQRDILMKKMADSDSSALRYRSDLLQKKNDVEQLTAQIEEEKQHVRTLNELNKSVEATRAHLQRELRSKEMENNRLHVQLKNMERETEEIRRDAEALTAAAKSERETLAAEKGGLKRATRSQRNRAEKAEEELKSMEDCLRDRERKLEEARAQADAWRERYQRMSDEKGRLEDHVQSLVEKVNDNDAVTRTNEIVCRNKESDLRKQIDRLTAENKVFLSEMERQKSDASLADERCRKYELEAAGLRADVRQHEGVVADLKAQLRKAKNEAEEALMTAERVERSSRRMREDGSNEIERVRGQMLERMKDLQPLPELLKETETKLQDALDKLHVYEQRSADQTRMIAEFTNKTDDHADEVSSLRQRVAALSDENRALEARLQIMHVKLDDRDVRVKETVLDAVNKDEKMQQLQLKLDEATHARDSLKRQLEAAVADSRRAVESEIDKASAREHVSQARIVDLETQITRLKTEIVSIKRSKEDMERRNQSKLQDARDRLEQAESTNRSMRSYVNFLKTSYNNVFGDASLTSTPIRNDRSGGGSSY